MRTAELPRAWLKMLTILPDSDSIGRLCRRPTIHQFLRRLALYDQNLPSPATRKTTRGNTLSWQSKHPTPPSPSLAAVVDAECRGIAATFEAWPRRRRSGGSSSVFRCCCTGGSLVPRLCSRTDAEHVLPATLSLSRVCKRRHRTDRRPMP